MGNVGTKIGRKRGYCCRDKNIISYWYVVGGGYTHVVEGKKGVYRCGALVSRGGVWPSDVPESYQKSMPMSSCIGRGRVASLSGTTEEDWIVAG